LPLFIANCLGSHVLHEKSFLHASAAPNAAPDASKQQVKSLLYSSMTMEMLLQKKTTDQKSNKSKLPAPTNTVVHQKVAGNGYKPGSPYYNLQEEKKGNKPATKKAEAVNVTATGGASSGGFEGCVDRVIAEKGWNGEQAQQGYAACQEQHKPTPEEVAKVNAKLIKYYAWTLIVTSVIWFIIVMIAAFVYQRNKKDPAVTLGGMGMNREDFNHGIFSCFENPSMTLLTCCCFAIRWADTMRMANFLNFWVGVVMLVVLEMLNPFTQGLSMLVLLFIAVMYRQKLRKEFGLESGDFKTCLLDCCCYCWCACCMAVQEGRQLEDAYAVGHPIRKVPGNTATRLRQ